MSSRSSARFRLELIPHPEDGKIHSPEILRGEDYTDFKRQEVKPCIRSLHIKIGKNRLCVRFFLVNRCNRSAMLDPDYARP
jgi:hypothetical protein